MQISAIFIYQLKDNIANETGVNNCVRLTDYHTKN